MISFKLLIEDLVKELRVSGDIKTAQYLIAYKDKVWLFPTEEILPKLAVEISKALDLPPMFNIDDVREAAEENQDIVVGSLNNKILYIYSFGSWSLDPRTSITLKKIVNQLKLKGVERSAGSDENDVVKKNKMKGDVPDMVYHGTSSKFLPQILNLGLKPGEVNSNYPNVISHPDLIFFSSRADEAMWHALHTSERYFKEGSQVPVILAFAIPDKNKLLPDYDIAAQATGTKRMKSWEYEKAQKNKKSNQLSREMGIWGYKGRIPASFIKYIYVPKDPKLGDNISDYKKMKPQAALKYIQKLQDYGMI